LNSSLNKIHSFLSDKSKRFLYLSYLGFYDRVDDKSFIEKKFRALLGYEPDLDHPVTFNEKINWLKLNYRKTEFTSEVDKYEVKKYVEQKLGSEFIIPNYGVWDRFDDIDFDSLPESFVLKCTHDSGSRVICRNKADLDMKAARTRLEKVLEHDYYKLNREWPYKDVRHRILAEMFLDNHGKALNDYRFYCFNGQPKFFSIDLEVNSSCRVNFYDPELKILPFGVAEEPPLFDAEVKMPSNIDRMLEIAKVLSHDHPFLRVDLYNVDGKIYFSELTFFSYGGFMGFCPDRSWDGKIGAYLDLPEAPVKP